MGIPTRRPTWLRNRYSQVPLGKVLVVRVCDDDDDKEKKQPQKDNKTGH